MTMYQDFLPNVYFKNEGNRNQLIRNGWNNDSAYTKQNTIKIYVENINYLDNLHLVFR